MEVEYRLLMIMSIVKKILKRLLGRGLGNEEKIALLIKGGAHIGKDLHCYGTVRFDSQYPFMLSIGDYVEITDNVTILNHDYSWCVAKRMTGSLMGGIGHVHIGNNVFIGTNSTILMNTEIGDNCIIGAGSVVSGKFPSNSVIAGVPARIVCSIEDFITKREKKQLEEAKNIVIHYRKAFGVNPPKEKLPAYFWLFESRSKKLTNHQIERMRLKDNYDVSMTAYLKSEPLFDNYEDFLKNV